jgi:FeS assembly SUF system protein
MSEENKTETPLEHATGEASGKDSTPQRQPAANLEERVVEAIKTCYDPEIPVDIYELGLIYGIDISPNGDVDIRMTLTSPACPAAGSLPPEVESKVGAIDGVSSVRVDVVWEPIWTPEKMSEAARLQLGMF